MITIFKNKNDIPEFLDYIELNDLYFNRNTISLLDDRAEKIVEILDESKLLSRYKICSRFNGTVLDVDMLSSGCKTVLNVMYNADKVFCIKECGNNALEVLYGLDSGYVYSDYAMIPFDMEAVNVQTKSGIKTIGDYEELKEWWEDEE